MTITVIGKLKDTKKYEGKKNFRVLSNRPDWSPELQKEFIREAMENGHALLFVSWEATGQYRNELIQILEFLLRETGKDK